MDPYRNLFDQPLPPDEDPQTQKRREDIASAVADGTAAEALEGAADLASSAVQSVSDGVGASAANAAEVGGEVGGGLLDAAGGLAEGAGSLLEGAAGLLGSLFD